MTLLEEAKKVKVYSAYTVYGDEEKEVALAWLKDEVVIKQVRTALKITNTPTYTLLARALKQAYKDGHLLIK